MTFAFDDQFTMFDVTPVENQFILEQLPGAKGDYVKVYLYGLMYCYHPREDLTPESMSRELNIPQDEILRAFRYWERHGLVHRISDHPPAWRYVNFRERSAASPDAVDPEYAAFSRELEEAFDGKRVFTGSETAAIFEWKEGGMQLPTEVILMILSHMMRVRGKSFRISDAEKLAMHLADENARTEGDAAEVLSRDEAATEGMRRILRLLGKRYNPSEANMKLYLKWTREWGFTQEAIEEACGQMQTSDPTLSMLDAILQKAYQTRSGNGGKLEREDVRRSAARHENMKAVMKALGRSGAVTPYQEEMYGRMLALYPQEIILLGAAECGRKRKDPESLLQLLTSWKDRGFTTREEVERHIAGFREKEEFLKSIRSRWSSRETDTGGRHMEMLTRWEEELGMSRELIMKAANYAADTRRPMAYLDALMNRYAEKGIRTPEAAEADRAAFASQYREMAQRAGQKLPAQQYSQRDYSGDQQAAIESMMNWSGEEDDA